MTSTEPDTFAPGDPDRVRGDHAAAPDGQGCPACPHRWEAHDALGRRFCTATRDVGWNRGCICR